MLYFPGLEKRYFSIYYIPQDWKSNVYHMSYSPGLEEEDFYRDPQGWKPIVFVVFSKAGK